ncbi:conserved hypothetical protein [Thiomonas sp. X19]|uniref:hypothetical protein n=1 Tax=Thiomonas sp. X19 TaxID=1050370 RepID=UPI000B67E236|nr:hypothetical protein [Thiomonas sp. X19]SCC94322.1 conserved hypothetical protein [Thiomonas sp. X19]
MQVANTGSSVKTSKAGQTPARAATPVLRKTGKLAPAVKATPTTRVQAKVKAPGRKTAPAKAVKPTPASAAKPPKLKLVRDSFTIPRNEYAVLDALKDRLVDLKRPAKKSEVLRAGIGLLATLSDVALLAALEAVPAIKTGRPKKAK